MKRKEIVDWLEANYEIYQEGEECAGFDLGKTATERACAASSVKGIMKFITGRGYTLKKDGKKLTEGKVVEAGEAHFEGKFEKAKAPSPKALPSMDSIKVKVDFEIDTSETDHIGTLGKVGQKMLQQYGKPELVDEDDLEEVEDEDKWTKEWRLDINGKAVSVYQLKDYEDAKEYEIAAKKPITKEIRMWCLSIVEDADFKKELEKWKKTQEKRLEKASASASEDSMEQEVKEEIFVPKKKVLAVEALDLEDL